MQKNNRPIKVFKAGAVKASIFQNESLYGNSDKPHFRVVIDRSYKDAQGAWKSTNGFSALTDVPKAILALSKAYEFVAMAQSEKPEGVVEEVIE
jgi:hypothetical protein